MERRAKIMRLRRILVGLTVFGFLAGALPDSTATAATGSAMITIRMSGALSAGTTMQGPSSACQLLYFPATKGKYARKASSVLIIAHNAAGVNSNPPAGDAIGLEMLDYKPALRAYPGETYLSVVLRHHSYLFSLFGSTAIAAHTTNGGLTGSFQATDLKPHDGTTGGKVNVSGTWTCAGFARITSNQP
jgi:hypothetical protein